MMNEIIQNQPTIYKSTLPFKAIIFDMDGTLLESTEADFKAWERTYQSYNRELTYEIYVTMLGIRSADVIRNFLNFKDEADVARVLKEKFNHFVDYVNEHPVKSVEGAGDFLQYLSNLDIKIGLATSSRQEKTMLCLGRLGLLQYFDAIVTGEQVNRSKPAPDIFLLAAKKLGVSPDRCVVVEDAPLGVAAAKSAEMKCIAITNTHPREKLSEADWIIESYEATNLSLLFNSEVL